MNILNKILIVFSLLFSCNTRNASSEKRRDVNEIKEHTPVLVLDNNAIQLKISVDSYLKDSIMVNITFSNIGDSDILLYKPLLPNIGSTLDLFSILITKSYERLKFTCKSSEQYFTSNSEATPYLIPRLHSNNFIILRKGEELGFRANIYNCYSFKEAFEKGAHEFLLSYMPAFPLMANGQQKFEIDPSDGIKKPVYFLVTVKKSDDPDDMRIKFAVPEL